MPTLLDLYASKGERQAVTALVTELLKHGPVTVRDEEGYHSVRNETDKETILKGCASTSMDTIEVDNVGCFVVIYQQSSREEAIADYTDSPLCNAIWEKASGTSNPDRS